MKKFKISSLILAVALSMGISTQAQLPSQMFKAAGSPVNPKVPVSWNRYYDHAGLSDICKKIAAAHPDLAKLQSIGKSYEGRDLWCLTITDFKKGGDPNKKPGMYIDGNIHSNEVQGAEFALYTAWYLTESFGDTKFIQELLEDKVFYIVPTINPDGRDSYFHKPNNASTPRSGVIPIDNDGDGLVNEDGFDDLNGDGHITMMRRKNPNGRYKIDPKDPRNMIMVGPDEKGEYEILGQEGYDNDGDGRVNEDGYTFEYDPNRDWGWGWQPNYIQNGAYKYPFSLPENRAVMEFVMKHPNIAAAQSFHNSGGMILRGPGGIEDVATYNAQDVAVYDAIGKKGEELLPGYRYLVVYKDLYSAYGGELDWFYAGRGIYTYSNELWTPFLMYMKEATRDGATSQYSFDRYLLFQDAFVPWQEYDHPQFGKIEIGGMKKNFGRAHPGFLLESDAHRNMAFSVYHCFHTPKLEVAEITEKDLGDGLKEVTAVIANSRLMPTHSSVDVKNKIEAPDRITLTTAGKVVTGMIVENRDLNLTTEQKTNPQTIEVPNIPGLGTVTVKWIVQGGGKYTVTVDSRKGGTATATK